MAIRFYFLSILVLITQGYQRTRNHEMNGITFNTQKGISITKFSSEFSVNWIPGTTNSLIALWPGLEPWGDCFNPINYGVLQPVLAYGYSCAKYIPKNANQWWISGQYINTDLNCKHVPNEFSKECKFYYAGYTCYNVGEYLLVSLNETIYTSIFFDETSGLWKQSIRIKNKEVFFSIKLNYCSKSSDRDAKVIRKQQEQNNAVLFIETYNYSKPIRQTFNNLNIQIKIEKLNKTQTCNDFLSFGKFNISYHLCSPIITNFEQIDDNILNCYMEKCDIMRN